MLLIAYLSAMMVGTFGFFALALLGACTLWLVYNIHQEFKPGGSGIPKLMPTVVLLTILIGFYFITKTNVANTPAEQAATLSFGQQYLSSLTFGHVCLMLAEYIGIGVVWSLFEARITLWRDKKATVKAWALHLETNISNTARDWLASQIGSSKTGNQVKTVNFKNALGDGEKTVVRDWDHLVGWGKYTIQHAFQDATAVRTTLAGARQEFKDDLETLHVGMKQFVAESEVVQFNPNTAYLKFQTNPDGSLTTSIEKGDLAICLANWTFWWWAYALNFVFGDMLEAVFTRFAAWVTKYYGAYVNKYFADIGLGSKPALTAVAPPAPVQPPATGTQG